MYCNMFVKEKIISVYHMVFDFRMKFHILRLFIDSSLFHRTFMYVKNAIFSNISKIFNIYLYWIEYIHA